MFGVLALVLEEEIQTSPYKLERRDYTVWSYMHIFGVYGPIDTRWERFFSFMMYTSFASAPGDLRSCMINSSFSLNTMVCSARVYSRKKMMYTNRVNDRIFGISNITVITNLHFNWIAYLDRTKCYRTSSTSYLRIIIRTWNLHFRRWCTLAQDQ